MALSTLASTWRSAAGRALSNELLEWPPDVFALANVLLERSEGFRFALSPIDAWPPRSLPGWAELVSDGGVQWSAWAEGRDGPLPALLLDVWSTVRDRAETPIEDVGAGLDQELCEALLTLHAIADEACAGLGVALDTADAGASVYRARGRELLARTGSMSRVDPTVLRVLPKVRTPPSGRQAFSRYACVVGPGIEAHWNKVPTRHRGIDPTSEYARLLLLPWPLRVRESDFRPIPGSVQRLAKDPFGFFSFAPQEPFDFELLDRVLVAAAEESGGVDVVCLPESAVDESEIPELEALLDRHGVNVVHAGVRQAAPRPDRFPSNWLHIGVNPSLEKGAMPSDEPSPWFHLRQNKHHRWSLDESQVYQYNLGGVLHPHVQWWEAAEVPRRAVEFVEVAELTFVGLVCEDLAQNGHIADLLRSVGPTIVMTYLLDGPQLNSRWAARYASVLADDPGSAVLTLTSHGMVQRCRPHGREASPVIALWKDSARGTREIPLEPGAQGVLLTLCADRTSRRSADGRWPVDNGTQCFDVAVHQVRAASTGPPRPATASRASAAPMLREQDLTILTAWAEAVAEVLAHAPERTAAVLAEASAGADWRSALGLPQPSTRLADAIDAMRDAVDRAPSFDALLKASADDRRGEARLAGLVRRVLLSMLEERHTRRVAAETAITSPPPPAARREALAAAAGVS